MLNKEERIIRHAGRFIFLFFFFIALFSFSTRCVKLPGAESKNKIHSESTLKQSPASVASLKSPVAAETQNKITSPAVDLSKKPNESLASKKIAQQFKTQQKEQEGIKVSLFFPFYHSFHLMSSEDSTVII